MASDSISARPMIHGGHDLAGASGLRAMLRRLADAEAHAEAAANAAMAMAKSAAVAAVRRLRLRQGLPLLRTATAATSTRLRSERELRTFHLFVSFLLNVDICRNRAGCYLPGIPRSRNASPG